jgi:hypothetical protein
MRTAVATHAIRTRSLGSRRRSRARSGHSRGRRDMFQNGRRTVPCLRVKAPQTLRLLLRAVTTRWNRTSRAFLLRRCERRRRMPKPSKRDQLVEATERATLGRGLRGHVASRESARQALRPVPRGARCTRCGGNAADGSADPEPKKPPRWSVHVAMGVSVGRDAPR